MKYLATLLLSIISFISFAGDTLWYDINWNKIDKKNAAFYRPKPQRINIMYSIKDYYIDGKLKFEGFSYYDTAKIWEGRVNYSFKNGNLESFVLYKMKNDSCKRFYKNDTLEGHCFFVNDSLDGKIFGYYKNDNINNEQFYKNEKSDGNGKHYYDSEILTKYTDELIVDTIILFYQNGPINGLVPFINGMKKGMKKQFYEYGGINEPGKFKNDGLNGWAISYYENGQKKEEALLKDDGLDGEYFEYFENGKLAKSLTYVKGEMDGKVLKYNYLNGKIEQEAFYKKNKRNGTYKNYDDDGNLIFDCFYKDDVITDYCYELTYNSEGKFIKKSPFDYMAYIQDYIEKNIPFYLEKINGRQDGKIELMDGNGNISVNGEILNGKKVNEWRYYDNKNNLIMSEYFTNGFLNGDRNVYNSVGAKIKQIPYKNGLLHGIVVEWDEVGEVSLNMFYKYGSRIKVRTTFYEEFYSKSVKTSGNLQVKSLDELEEISDDYDIKIEVPYSDNEGYPITELVQILDFKIAENPKGEKRDLKGVKFDTTYHNSFFVTTQISTVLKKKDLQTETKNFDDILFNVETTIDGSYVLDRYRDYKPMKNEFILFYQNSEYDISHQQIEVRIGSKIKKAINNNSFNGYAIVELLDGGIFYKSKFPGSLVFRKMEEEAKKE